MELDFEKIKSKNDLLNWISLHFQFPSYFWRNWDAVSDCLSDFCTEETHIKLKNSSSITKEIEKEMTIFLDIVNNFNISSENKIHIHSK